MATLGSFQILGGLSRSSMFSTTGDKANEMFNSRKRAASGRSDNAFIRNVDFLWSKISTLGKGTASDSTANGDYEFAASQIRFGRAWNLFSMGLQQSDALYRYMAMAALGRVLPTMQETLPDSSMREMLSSLLIRTMASDCRPENRLKAICLLGQLGVYLGEAADDLLVLPFKELALSLLSIQIREKAVKNDPNRFRAESRTFKIYLIQALGKYARYPHKHSRDVEDLLLYMLRDEMDNGDSAVIAKNDKKARVNEGAACVVLAILNVFNIDMCSNETNQMYVGALFKLYVHPLVRTNHPQLQSAAIRFVSKWMPITLETAHIFGFEALLSGLKRAEELGAFDKHQSLLESQRRSLKAGQEQVQLKVALRAKIVRQMLMVPGTFAKMAAVEDHDCLFYGKFSGCDVLCSLPIHQNSNVLISRPHPAIPGVPSAATTIPPVFVDTSYLSKIRPPRSRYEYMERTGQVLGLPSGYSYSPHGLVDLDAALVDTGPKLAPNSSLRDRNLAIGIGKGRSTQVLAKRSQKHDIPPNTQSQPPGVVAANILDPTKAPYGFLSTCPFPGFDAEMIEPPSSGKLTGLHSRKDSSRTLVVSVDGPPPPGYTFDKRETTVTFLFIRSLKPVGMVVDFPEGAPVIFDIIQPGTQRLQRVLTRIVCINKELSAVNVQPDNSDDPTVLMVGATFNIFVRSRRKPFEWTAINLEVIDDDYQDDIVFSQRKVAAEISARYDMVSSNTAESANRRRWHDRPMAADRRESTIPNVEDHIATRSRYSVTAQHPTRGSHSAHALSTAIPNPSGFLHSGVAFFAPPCNLPPTPAGYLSMNQPYFGRPPNLKPAPAGVTLKGTRFYLPESQSFGDGPKAPLAGFDSNGHPFFFPRAAILPPPAGFTHEGIPYYDGLSFVQARGVLLLNAHEALQQFDGLDDSGSDDSAFGSGDELGNQIALTRTVSAQSVKKSGRSRAEFKSSRQNMDSLLAELEAQQPLLCQRMLNLSRTRGGNALRIQDISRILNEEATESGQVVIEPTDIIGFLRDSDDLAYLKSPPMRLVFEPSTMEFRSVNTTMSSTATLKYRAYRGDRDEHSFFVSIDTNVFSVSSTHLMLQGEGTIELTVTFHPRAIKNDRIDTIMSLIDDTGKKLAVCNLVAVRQSFVKVKPTRIDAGWLLPGQRKECAFIVENVSTVGISLSIEMQGQSGSEDPLQDGPFHVLSDDIRMQPGEKKQWNVAYEPKHEGRFSDVIIVKAPGGDLVKVPIEAFAGVPVAIYAESESNSRAGASVLSKDRSALLKKLRRTDKAEKRSNFSEEEQHIVDRLLNSASKAEMNELDLGVCYQASKNVTRCVTLFNLSDTNLTVGLHAHSTAIICPGLATIPSFGAVSIEVEIKCGEDQPVSGNLISCIEILCPDFQNTPLVVKAFIGLPLFFLSWDVAFFKPCMVGQTESLVLTLVNQSQYDLSVVLDNLNGPRSAVNVRTSSFGSSVSSDDLTPTVVKAQSATNALFSFLARERGPLLQTITFRILNPVCGNIPTCVNGKSLTLVGICIEPYPHSLDDVLDKNGIEYIKQWMSHPKRLLDEYPGGEEKARHFDLTPVGGRKSGVAEVMFQRDLLIYRPQVQNTTDITEFNNPRRPISNPLKVTNKSKHPTTVSFIASTNFSIDPKKPWLLQAAESYNTEIMFLPPLDRAESSIVYGFGMALDEVEHTFHAVSLVCRPASDVVVFPSPDSDGHVIVDFGLVDVASYWLGIHTRHVLLVNTGSSTMAWTIKLGGGRTKYSAFEAGSITGELAPSDTYAIPFKFHSEVSGSFDVTADLSVKDATDRLSKGSHLASIVLRGQSVNTSLTGMPEQIEFGSAVVMNRKAKGFLLSNNGSRDMEVRLKVTEPFVVNQEKLMLAARDEAEIEVLFLPTESRGSSSKLLVFANHRLWEIPVNGVGGTTDLVCERFNHRDVDIGLQREGTLAWVNIQLTNRGTIPLVLNDISADMPNFVKVRFMGLSAGVVDEASTLEQKLTIRVGKDYWAIFKRKMIVFATLRKLLKEMVSKARKLRTEFRRPQFNAQIGGKPIVVRKHSDILQMESTSIANLPPLRPLSSYHFLIGSTPKAPTEMHFHYEPLTTVEDERADATSTTLIKSTSLKLTGKTYRSLEFFPPFHDFGLAPAEVFIDDDYQRHLELSTSSDYGVTRDGDKEEGTVLNLDVLNLSSEIQNLSLTQIAPAFHVKQRAWNIQPGDRVSIPVEFHPQREQLQYRGEVHFAHTHGVAVVRLAGTGASADLSCDSEVNFGALKVNRVGTKSFKLINHGLLDCQYQLRIVQMIPDFKFVSTEEPYELEAKLAPGAVDIVQIRCCSGSIDAKDATIVVRWLRVPNGLWEEIIVPLHVEIGMPVFRLHTLEVDFETTYMRLGKVVEIQVVNDGNAECHWNTESEIDVLSIEPSFGNLLAGQTAYLQVIYQPTDYEQLNSSITFNTDAGTMALMCYGVVGVPFISIPEDHLRLDFGVAAIGKSHVRTIVVTNSGRKTLSYEVKIDKAEQDGVGLSELAASIFDITPPQGKIQPQQQISLTCTVKPVDYDSLYTAQFSFSTNNGEQYDGMISVKGGKAIVTLAAITLGKVTGSRAGAPAKAISKEAKSLAIDNHFEVLQSLANELVAAQVSARGRAETTAETKKEAVSSAGSARPHSSRAGSMMAGVDGAPKSSKARALTGAVEYVHAEYMTEDEIALLLRPIQEFLGDVQAELTMSDDLSWLDKAKIVDRLIADSDQLIASIGQQVGSHQLDNKSEVAACIRRAHVSSRSVKLLERGVSEQVHEDVTLQEFDLGLVRGGVGVAGVDLFTMPNIGNMVFEFALVEEPTHVTRPENRSTAERAFVVTPTTGSIEPSASVSFLVDFRALTTGTYRNTYKVVSNEVDIVDFAIVGRVGNAIISIDKPVVDLGLIPRKQKTMQTFVVKNMGTYEDKWRIVPESKNASPDIFTFNAYEGELAPGQETMVEVYFSSNDAGTYNRNYIIIWTGVPVTFQVTGIAGAPELYVDFVDEDDQALGGMDWGVCVVDCQYTKVLVVKNRGNVDGRFVLTHPNKTFTFEAIRDSEGLIAVSPGGSASVNIVMTPLKAGPIREPLQVVDEEISVLQVPMKALCGTCDYKVVGELKYLNMGVNEVQSSSIVVTNTGDIEIPMEFSMEPNLPIFTIKSSDFESGSLLMPSRTVIVEVSACPKKTGVCEAALVIRTNLGKGFVTKELSFSFRAYNEQLEVDDTEDIVMGRIMVGQTQNCSRNMTNYGSSPIQYRLAITEVDEEEDDDKSKKKKKGSEGPKRRRKAMRRIAGALSQDALTDSPWTIISECEGVVEPGSSIPFEFSFAARDADSEDMKEVRIIVEKMLTKWTECAAIKVTAALGRPRLEIEPSQVDFRIVSVGGERGIPISLKNQGTVLLKYEILKPWDSTDVFDFIPGTALTGTVEPNESEQLTLLFKPKISRQYSTKIGVQTQIGISIFEIAGRGATYEIAERYLPKDIDLGQLFFGECRDTSVMVRNGCVFELFLSGSVSSDGASEFSAGEVFGVTPPKVELGPNPSENANEDDCTSGEFVLSAQMAIPILENGLGDAAVISELIRLGQCRRNMQISVEGGSISNIPIMYYYSVQPLSLVRREVSQDAGDTEIESEISFGDVAMSEGATQIVHLVNKNAFKVSFQATVPGHSVIFDASSSEIEDSDSIECRIRLPPLIFSADETVPKSIPVSALIRIQPHILEMRPIEVSVSGIYIDVPMELDLFEPVSLGYARVHRAGMGEFVFTNPVRRRLEWTVRVEDGSSELFWIREGEQTGEAKSGTEIKVPIQFKPLLPISYTCQAFIETGEGSFVVQFTCEGVEPKLTTDKDSLDFGVVGVGEPEFRVISLLNPTPLPVTARLRGVTDVFVANHTEVFEIAPNGTFDIEITCSPLVYEEQVSSTLEIIDADPDPETDPTILVSIKVLTVGGQFVMLPPGTLLPGSSNINLNLVESAESLDALSGGSGFEPQASLVASATNRGLNVMEPAKERRLSVAERSKSSFGSPSRQGSTMRDLLDDALSTDLIQVDFGEVVEGTRIRRVFELENAGDTVIDLGVFAPDGDEWGANTDFETETAKFKMDPVLCKISAKTKQVFEISIRAKPPQENNQIVFDFTIRTRSLKFNRVVPIRAFATVLPKSSTDGLRSFARADDAIEGTLSLERLAEFGMESDKGLWKLLRHVVRLDEGRPSHHLASIDFVEPDMSWPSVHALVTRPPPLPLELPMGTARRGAAVGGRVALTTEPLYHEPPNAFETARRQEAARFIAGVERKVSLVTKRV
ncbi:hypothetical protein SmJEL517_g05942 [Synchytrium microbalum]|uniref:Uncharacterized protein n=1 Tax=Synchytrium microbalum TaxID=1806994 RepID=A0A507BS58_9FUNG|nr:uncharacterized protein SmJEL517_g05942 [Synchytrium microbalum]TPX30512.1 hypothetical protein SmJEL517_g05942 [Synchytrium microbalum]